MYLRFDTVLEEERMNSILRLNNVSYVYSKGTPFEKVAISDINVEFEKGKITGLIGHTGSGKSTLVNLLNGLLRPSAGEIFLNGENIWANPKEISKIRYRVGLVMQYPEYQLFDETVALDIGFGPRNIGLSDSEVEQRVRSAAEFTGIDSELLSKSPFELSGGQKRRVAIAGILAMMPDVLVLDEPAAGLDPLGRRSILGGLCRYMKEYGTTVILVSHSMEDMAQYCDNVVVMNQGKIFATGTTEQIFSDYKMLSDVGLDAPAALKIAEGLKREGIALEGKLYTAEGVFEAITRYKNGIGGERV